MQNFIFATYYSAKQFKIDSFLECLYWARMKLKFFGMSLLGQTVTP